MALAPPQPGWCDVIRGYAATERTARRLTEQLRACEAAALAFCRLLERWNRGEAVPATPGGAKPRSGTRPTGSRPRSQGWRRRSRATCSSSSQSAPRAARGTAGPEPGSSSNGARCSTAPGSTPARTVLPRPISSSPCSCAHSRASPTPRASTAPRIGRRSGPASSICATRCSARRSTTCGPSRRSAGAVTGFSPSTWAYAVPCPPPDHGRRLDQPRPRRSLRGAAPPRRDGDRSDARAVSGRKGGQSGGCVRAARRRGAHGRRGRPRRLRGRGARRSRERPASSSISRVDEPTGIALITVDATGETTIVVSPGANALVGGLRAAAVRRRPLPAGDPDDAIVPPGSRHGPVLPQRRARAADSGRPGPRGRQPLRARVPCAHRRPRRADPRSRGRGPARGRRGGRARGPAARSTSSTARPQATPSPLACSCRCSRAGSRRRRSCGPARPARSLHRGSEPNRRCRPRPRSTRSSAASVSNRP